MGMSRTCVTANLLLAFLISGEVFAETSAPLLEAKGQQKQCESLSLWTAKVIEFAGQVILNSYNADYHTLAKPAFADSVFAPRIGKPYRSLSKGEKKKILKVITRCQPETARWGWVQAAFGPENSPRMTRRDKEVIAFFESATDVDARRAQQAANLRLAKEREYWADRPKRVQRRLDFDQKKAKRQKLFTKECMLYDGWYFQYNDYIYDAEKVISRKDSRSGYATCLERGLVYPNVVSLVKSSRGGRDFKLFAIDDLCGPNPEILFIYKGGLGVELPKYGEVTKNSRVGVHNRSPHIDSIPYRFFVTSGSDGINRGRFLTDVEAGLLATRDILIRQCKKVPESVRVYGGTLKNGVPNNPYSVPTPRISGPIGFGKIKVKGTSPNLSGLEYSQFYSGTFYPMNPERRLVHDDMRLAETYAGFVEQYKEFQLAYQRESSRRKEAQYNSVGFLALVLWTAFSVNPCNDESIPYEVRDDNGCFRP